jgi:serine/threonine protein kinase/regulation of enolase protein 1 (concanavalin A-like superfamily)
MTPSEPRPGPGVPDPEATHAYFPDAPAFSPPGSAGFAFLDPPKGPDELGWLAHYRVLKVIGEGGMGLVLRAEDSQLARPVALKVIRPELADAPTVASRFAREARLAAAIKHDHIVTIYQVGQHRDVAYLAMEYLQGISLQGWLDRGRKPSVDLILRIGREVASGLAAAHGRGLIHRDIKPGNLWLESPTGRVKILDFGHARALREDVQITHAGTINGSPAFMSPEQARGESGDASCDLFSLGCVLYRLCTGELPFPGSTILAVLTSLAVDTPRHPREIDPALPPALGDLVMQLLSKKPEGRPASAQAVVDAIRGIERQLATDRQASELGSITSARSIVEVPPPPPSPKVGRRWRGAAVAVVGLTSLGLAWAGFSAATRPRKPEIVPDALIARAVEAPADPPAPVAVEPVPTPAPPEVAGPPKPPDPPTAPRPMPEPPRPAAEAVVSEGSKGSSPFLSPWGPFLDPDGDCKVSVDEEHNRITIGVPGKAHILSAELGRINAPRLLRDVRGDFEARVRVSGTDHPSGRATTTEYAPYHGAGLLVWQDPENYLRLEIATDVRKGKPFRYANFELRKGGMLASSKGLKIDDHSSLLRIERRGGLVRASFGTDGVNWTSFPPLEVEFPDRLQVGLTAINSATKPLLAILEDFAVAPPPDLRGGVPEPPVPNP